MSNIHSIEHLEPADDKDDWPELESALKTGPIRKKTSVIDIALDHQIMEDITAEEEAKIQLLTFMPKIKLLGFDLWLERRRKGENNTYAGMLVRVLDNKKDERRCLQYVYVYTRQVTLVSAFWMVLVPLFMVLFRYTLPWLDQADSLCLCHTPVHLPHSYS